MKKSEAEDAWLRKMPVDEKIKAGIVVQALVKTSSSSCRREMTMHAVSGHGISIRM